ncbi:LANO_0H18558g1_1 [Lachancea nothofagi CBS 11611]|uniref:LANO_0H18558g1_1 n=1 Tax=Lachancea nothofagi CBS 11611 TaxID=1266666 RepID=A0A1G4KN27_9SACH|nr:LANO_0H18558g1_1 [Lachancea nothofagi CBS 11611]
MDLKANVALLLLQIVLYRQQELSHADKSLKLDDLLQEPIVDDIILTKFNTHRLVKLYASGLSGLQLRTLKGIVRSLFNKGLPDKNAPVTVVTLANYYYYTRVAELEQEQIPKLKKQISELIPQRNGEIGRGLKPC